MRTIGTIIIVIVTTIFCLNVDALPTIGDINSAPNQHITPTYIEDGQHDTGSPNLVTAVLADYRGFDTLGRNVGYVCSWFNGCFDSKRRQE